jgi:hypothetical protein
MPPVSVPLSRLSKLLAKKQTELERLRRQYENRLTRLKRRKEELESQLREVDAEIQAVSQESTGPADELAAQTLPAKGRRGKRLKLPGLIVKLIHEAGRPLTVKELAQEVKRRRFPTKSKDIALLVQARVYEMVKKGALARADGQSGFVLGSGGQQLRGSTTAPARKAKAAGPSRTGRRGGQPPLREVLTKILEKCKDPISGGELAQKALDTGYKSTSKSFRDVVWVNLGNMDNVEHVEGKGYRLKRR